jgi:hypothetical protein
MLYHLIINISNLVKNIIFVHHFVHHHIDDETKTLIYQRVTLDDGEDLVRLRSSFVPYQCTTITHT